MNAREIIKALGGVQALADETGLAQNSIRYWAVRERIPAEYWLALARLAERKGCREVTLDALAQHRAPQPRRVA